jgi:hypothetical protein
MKRFNYKGLFITKNITGLGPRFVNILLPCGKLITGHSVCSNFLRHYSTSNTEDVSSSNTTPSVTPVMTYKNLDVLAVISIIKKHYLVPRESMLFKTLTQAKLSMWVVV